jgi:hypothetical protein
MDPHNLLKQSPYNPTVIANILAKYPAPEQVEHCFDSRSALIFQNLCNTIDTMAGFGDPNEELKYFDEMLSEERPTLPGAYHRRPSLWNLAGKVSLFFRLKTPSQFMAYQRDIAVYPLRIVDEGWSQWLPRQHARKSASQNTNYVEEYMGYRPWQMFCMVYELGKLAEKAFQTNQAYFVESAVNIKSFGKWISRMIGNAQSASGMVWGARDSNPAFFYTMNAHRRDQADVLQIRFAHIRPYSFMKRLLHALINVVSTGIPMRNTVIYEYIKRMLEQNVLFYNGVASSDPLSLFRRYENIEQNVLDEVIRALNEEIEIQICITSDPALPNSTLHIMRNIETLLNEEQRHYSDRRFAFMSAMSRRMGERSIVNRLDNELAKMIANNHDLSYEHRP